MPEDGEEDIDSIYQITYYNQYPDLNIKQGYWIQNDFLELFPQSTPPYNLLVQWSDEQGKKVIDHILEENSKVMTKEDYTVTNNEYRIISDIYFESPHLYLPITSLAKQTATAQSFFHRLSSQWKKARVWKRSKWTTTTC